MILPDDESICRSLARGRDSMTSAVLGVTISGAAALKILGFGNLATSDQESRGAVARERTGHALQLQGATWRTN
jgi:hypothetical protein